MLILDKSTRNKIVFEFSGEYIGACLKNFQRIEQKLKIAFLANVFIFSENFVTLENYLWNFISGAADVSAAADITCQRKNFHELFQNPS